jgi:hypothetical protein
MMTTFSVSALLSLSPFFSGFVSVSLDLSRFLPALPPLPPSDTLSLTAFPATSALHRQRDKDRGGQVGGGKARYSDEEGNGATEATFP